MDAAEALTDLTDVSTQVREAVVLEQNGAILASTLDDEVRARQLADAVRAALQAAGSIRATGGARVTALEAATRTGSLFVAAGKDAVCAATTGPDEPSGLVLYDLRACLRSIEGDR
jgi:predicted regulator of Ras-like GTPase activity (Roadblock/LC7/MglB family)